MESNNSYSTDHGLNMDSAPSSHDNPCTNMEPLPTDHDDSSSTIGQSASQPSVTQTKGQLRCVNCGLNLQKIRRHLLELAEVRKRIQEWVRPRKIEVTRDSVVCHSCWTAAWDQIRDPSSVQQDAPVVGLGRACIDCGRSLLRLRSHTLRSDSPREERIRNVIAHKIAPRELLSLSRVCHKCWQKADRAAPRLTVKQESSDPSTLSSVQSEVGSNASHPVQQRSDTSDCILLPNYVRAPASQNKCFFPSCNSSDRHTVPSALRASLFCEYNYYVPPECRICNYHLNSNSWNLLLESIHNPIKTFSATQIEDFVTLLKGNMNNHLDFENIQSLPEHIVHYYLGLTKAQYRQVLSEVPTLSSKHRGSFALAAYLMKLRTGDTNERMSTLLQVPRSTLERLMNMASEILSKDSVP